MDAMTRREFMQVSATTAAATAVKPLVATEETSIGATSHSLLYLRCRQLERRMKHIWKQRESCALCSTRFPASFRLRGHYLYLKSIAFCLCLTGRTKPHWCNGEAQGSIMQLSRLGATASSRTTV